MGHTLIALGGAFLAAFVLGRLGRRLGLPTIPLFMLAGVLFGPNTPGHRAGPAPRGARAGRGHRPRPAPLLPGPRVLARRPDRAAAPRCSAAARSTSRSTSAAGSCSASPSAGAGAEALVVAGVVGISSSAIVTKLLVELRRLANPETKLILGVIVVEDVFLALYLAALQPLLSDTTGRGRRAVAFGKAVLFLLALTAVARWGGRARRPAARAQRRRAADRRLPRAGPAGGRPGRGGRGVRRHRRLHDRHGHRREPGGRPGRAPGAAPAGRLRRRLLLHLRPDRRPGRRGRRWPARWPPPSC